MCWSVAIRSPATGNVSRVWEINEDTQQPRSQDKFTSMLCRPDMLVAKSSHDQLFHASNVLYIVVLGLAKCSASLSIISLTVPQRGSIRGASSPNQILYAISTASAVAWTIGSTIALALQCSKVDLTQLNSSSCNGSVCEGSHLAAQALTKSFSCPLGQLSWRAMAQQTS